MFDSSIKVAGQPVSRDLEKACVSLPVNVFMPPGNANLESLPAALREEPLIQRVLRLPGSVVPPRDDFPRIAGIVPGKRQLSIVCGGQTGSDEAALVVAEALGLERGGFVPTGRRTEDPNRPVDMRHPVTELQSDSFDLRTWANALNSDATLLLGGWDKVADGSVLTVEAARQLGKPFMWIDATKPLTAEIIGEFWSGIENYDVRKLNVAGPRASFSPEIYPSSIRVLRELLDPTR